MGHIAPPGDPIFDAVRSLERSLWASFAQAGAPFLLLCLEMKVVLTGTRSTGRLLRRAQCLIYAGHRDEAAILLDRIKASTLSHGGQEEADHLERELAGPSQQYHLRPLSDLEHIRELTEKLHRLEAMLQASSFTYCRHIFGLLLASLHPFLGTAASSGEIACTGHVTQMLCKKSIEFPHRHNGFLYRVRMICPECGRIKIISQKTQGAVQVEAQSEIRFYAGKS